MGFVIKSMYCMSKNSLFVRLLDWAGIGCVYFHRITFSRSTPIKNEAISLGNDLHK